MNGIISFDYPWVLAGFAIFIAFVLYDYLSVRRKQLHKSLPKYLRIKLISSRIFFRIFLVCIIIALAGPRWGMGQTAHKYHQGRRLTDVVIAFDVSRSMDIHDMPGGIPRRDRGMAIVKDAVTAMPKTRFAVAISRNQGIVAVPLTWDYDAVFAFLDVADSSLTGRGTNLESLIDAAAGAFQSSNLSTRVILLVSDGEALSGSLKEAVGRCKREGIAVSAIAVGSDEGGFLSDDSGIISRRDSGAMRMAAGQTGGIYIDGNREDASRALTGYLRSLSPGSEVRNGEGEHPARWFIFVILGIITFGTSKLSLLKIRN